MNDLLYNGVSLAALVLGVVQVVKKVGFSGRQVQALAVALAFVVFAGGKASEVYPQIKMGYEIVLAGLYGISASGIYDVIKGLSGGGVK